MTTVWKRELRCYFKTPIGYVFIAVFVFLLGLFASSLHFSAAMNGFEYTLYNACFVYLILVPLLTMRSMAEERRQKTDRLLLSLPLSSAKIVLGKYFALVSVLTVPILIVAALPLVMTLYGSVNLPLAYASLLGFYLLGAALCALGLFLSSLTENQIVSAVLSFLVMLCAYFMGSLSQMMSSSAQSSLYAFLLLALGAAALMYFFTKRALPSVGVFSLAAVVLILLYFLSPASLEGAFSVMVSTIGLFDRFYLFVNGIFDWQSILYYASVSFLFVFFTVLNMEKRRWSE